MATKLFTDDNCKCYFTDENWLVLIFFNEDSSLGLEQCEIAIGLDNGWGRHTII